MRGERLRMTAAVISGGGELFCRIGSSKEDEDATVASGITTSVARERWRNCKTAVRPR